MNKQLTTEEKRKWIYDQTHDKYYSKTIDWNPGLVHNSVKPGKSKSGFYRVVNSFKLEAIDDQDFYENDNLSQQYYTAPQRAETKVGAAIAESAAESSTLKKIENAEKETRAYLTLFTLEGSEEFVHLDFLFFNKSFIRPMNDFNISATFGKGENQTVQEYEMATTREFTGENEFKNLVSATINKNDIFKMAQSEAEFIVSFDNVSVRFTKSFSLVDALALDFLNCPKQWNDEIVEKYYPVFLGDKVKKDVKGVVVEDKEFVKLFVEGPLNIPQFAALNSYCEMTNKKSSFIEKINGIFDKMKKDVVRTELMDLEKRIKRGPKVISGLFLSIGALLIAIAILYSSFTDDFGWNLKVTLCLWMVNWAVCFMLALTETEIKEKLKNLFFGLSGVLVILHIIWGIQCLGEDFGFHLWGSWIVLVGGLVVGINMGEKYSAKSFGPETKSLIDAIKKAIDKL